MIKPLDREVGSLWFIAERLAQELNEPLASLYRSLPVIFLADLSAILIARHGTDIDVVPHKSPPVRKAVVAISA
jgi:hypothetical protein